MPSRPKVPCQHPGCPELVEPGSRYCEKHKALHPDPMARPSSTSRGYGSKWQKVSRQYLQAHPLCVRCLEKGKYTKATVVDHIKPHRGDPGLFWNPDNWQPLCKACHDKKTWTEDAHILYEY